jgi:transcriptional regulator with XRE-family HTH domain
MNRIKEIRELKGLDQKDLAALMGISAMGLSYLESGKNNPTKHLTNISEILNCTVGQLRGVEPVEGLDSPPMIGFKEEYVTHAISIIEELIEPKDLTKEGRSKLLSDVYKLVYDYFENNKEEEYLENLLEEAKRKAFVINGVLKYVKNFDKENAEK